MVVASASPMDRAAPPRRVELASGAPNNTMMKQVNGKAIFSACCTISFFGFSPERSSASMNCPSSA